MKLSMSRQALKAKLGLVHRSKAAGAGRKHKLMKRGKRAGAPGNDGTSQNGHDNFHFDLDPDLDSELNVAEEEPSIAALKYIGQPSNAMALEKALEVADTVLAAVTPGISSLPDKERIADVLLKRVSHSLRQHLLSIGRDSLDFKEQRKINVEVNRRFAMHLGLGDEFVTQQDTSPSKKANMAESRPASKRIARPKSVSTLTDRRTQSGPQSASGSTLPTGAAQPSNNQPPERTPTPSSPLNCSHSPLAQSAVAARRHDLAAPPPPTSDPNSTDPEVSSQGECPNYLT